MFSVNGYYSRSTTPDQIMSLGVATTSAIVPIQNRNTLNVSFVIKSHLMYVRKTFCLFPDFSDFPDPDFGQIRFHIGESGCPPHSCFDKLVLNH